MPPASTQSPSRFLGGQRPRPSALSTAQRPSTLSKETSHAEHPPIAAISGATINPASQFVPTPKFSRRIHKASALIRPQRSPPGSGFVEALRSSTRPSRDDVVNDDDDDENEMLDVEHESALPTTEDVTGRERLAFGLPFSPKRRRIDDVDGDHDDQSDLDLLHSRPVFEAPQMGFASQPANTLPPRFVAQTIAPATATQTEENSLQRPAFLRPSLPPAQETSEPLPEAFSPHRRGQKFVSGGLASTVQGWAIEMGQAAAQSRRVHAYLQGEDYVLKLRVEAIYDAGSSTLLLLKGSDGSGAMSDVMLSGDGGMRRKERVEAGTVVGIRAPTWEVQADGRSWTMGVDWRVI